MPSVSRAKIQSAERALRLLEYVAQSPDAEVSLSDIASALDVPPSTAHHLVRTLLARGYLAQNPATRRYSLGTAALTLATATMGKFALLQVAPPLMRRFASETEEAVTLAVLDWPWAMAIYRAEPGSGLPEGASSARRAPVYCTAVGKVLVSEMTEDEVRALLETSGMEPRTPHTLTSPEAFLAEVEWVRRHGLAVDNEEWVPGVRCVAVPVRDYAGHIVAAVSVAGSVKRLDGQYLDGLIRRLRSLARAISSALGYKDAEAGEASS